MILSMYRSLYSACALLVCALPTALAQNNTPACSAGVVADGYIDFTQLPTAPNIAPGGTSQQITATLPVEGISGLTVRVIIPPLTSPFGGGLYSTRSGLLSVNAYGGAIHLVFNKPVYGLSFEGSVTNRGASFSLTTNTNAESGIGGAPPNFASTVSFNALPPFPYGAQLQTAAVISDAFLAFPSAYSGNPVLANLRVQSKSNLTTATVPANGLEMWLQSPAASPEGLGTPSASVWHDASGNNHDATAGMQAPLYAGASGPNCQGGYAFSQNQYFNFNLPISGWDAMTIFLVSKSFTNPPAGTYGSLSAAILWNETSPWGNTFISPWQTTAPFRFGTQQVNNQPAVVRPTDIGQDFTISRAVHDGSTDSLWVNGLEVFSQGGKQAVLSGTSGAAYLGRGINNSYFNGEISEVLVYNRAVSAGEAAAVESYLRNKFGTR
jgi:Concanavalin A-like lectin/glucanases superfamily